MGAPWRRQPRTGSTAASPTSTATIPTSSAGWTGPSSSRGAGSLHTGAGRLRASRRASSSGSCPSPPTRSSSSPERPCPRRARRLDGGSPARCNPAAGTLIDVDTGSLHARAIRTDHAVELQSESDGTVRLLDISTRGKGEATADFVETAGPAASTSGPPRSSPGGPRAPRRGRSRQPQARARATIRARSSRRRVASAPSRASGAGSNDLAVLEVLPGHSPRAPGWPRAGRSAARPAPALMKNGRNTSWMMRLRPTGGAPDQMLVSTEPGCRLFEVTPVPASRRARARPRTARWRAGAAVRAHDRVAAALEPEVLGSRGYRAGGPPRTTTRAGALFTTRSRRRFVRRK